jgi:hypothetical protein
VLKLWCMETFHWRVQVNKLRAHNRDLQHDRPRWCPLILMQISIKSCTPKDELTTHHMWRGKCSENSPTKISKERAETGVKATFPAWYGFQAVANIHNKWLKWFEREIGIGKGDWYSSRRRWSASKHSYCYFC